MGRSVAGRDRSSLHPLGQFGEGSAFVGGEYVVGDFQDELAVIDC